ncbi:hypothetical protein LIER_37934 [Lithospermum erythrorhizon]|uniref:Uncharacterized protein n=1 Tax=Lithospermum erythrorhizon TaxID=34254 RepID=A0AAV3PS93_LITER
MHRLVRRLKQPSSLKHLRCLSSTHLLNPPPCSRRYDYYINNPNNNVFCYCSSYSRTISRSYCYSVGSGDTNKKVGLEKPSSAIGLAFGSVVKIFTFTSVPDYSMPWQSHGQGENIGSGFVITGKRILTNAHVVAHHTFIRVMKHGSSEKYRAEVQAIGHECDLAILVVKCKEFWKGMNSLTLGDIPFLQDAVSVVGYPIEGDNISVTKGVVSRVEPTKYDHGATTLLAIHIDAHINLGNDGAPAVLGDLSVVGVACAEKPNGAGYIIPAPVIKHFIAGVDESGKYAGFCSMGLTCQHTENSQLREHFRMHPNMTGVLVNKINPLSDASKVLKKDDILLSFDGVRIANNGTGML